jgi:hypothetical protein
MTVELPKVSTLTADRKRFLIAEVCGTVLSAHPSYSDHDDNRWFDCDVCKMYQSWRDHLAAGYKFLTGPCPGSDLDFLESLDAMHEAEKHLTLDQCVGYERLLRKAAIDETEWDTAAPAFEFFAPVWVRVDSFLIVTGKAQP